MVSNQIITLHDSTFSKSKQKPFAKYVNTLNRAIYVKVLYQQFRNCNINFYAGL